MAWSLIPHSMLLGFSCTTISSAYRESSEREKILFCSLVDERDWSRIVQTDRKATVAKINTLDNGDRTEEHFSIYKIWNRWATTAENHPRYHSCQMKTRLKFAKDQKIKQ